MSEPNSVGTGWTLSTPSRLKMTRREFRGLARELAVLVDVAERDLAGDTEAYDALGLQPVQEITAVLAGRRGHAAASGRAERAERRDAGQQ